MAGVPAGGGETPGGPRFSFPRGCGWDEPILKQAEGLTFEGVTAHNKGFAVEDFEDGILAVALSDLDRLLERKVQESPALFPVNKVR